jgi:hypothetical protein
MATSSTSPDTSSTSVPKSAPKQYNLRNPLPLSAPQEQEVKLLYYKRVRAHCAPEIKGMQFTLLYTPNPSPLHNPCIALASQKPVMVSSGGATPDRMTMIHSHTWNMPETTN